MTDNERLGNENESDWQRCLRQSTRIAELERELAAVKEREDRLRRNYDRSVADLLDAEGKLSVIEREPIASARALAGELKRILMNTGLSEDTANNRINELRKVEGRFPITCYHCGYIATTTAEADAHFGDEGGFKSLCVEWSSMPDADRAQAYQEMSVELEGERKESSELRSQLAALRDQNERLRELLSVVVTEVREFTNGTKEIALQVNGVLCIGFHGTDEAASIQDWRLRRDAALAIDAGVSQ